MINIEDIAKKFDTLKSQRLPFENLWKSVRQYVLPRAENIDMQAQDFSAKIFSNTPMDYRSRLAAGMYSWMTPSDQKWFELSAILSEEEQNLEEEKQFFALTSKRIMEVLQNSNFNKEMIKIFNNVASGLPGVLFVEKSEKNTISCTTIPAENICYSQNHLGNIDIVFREYSMTERQILQAFPDSTFRINQNEFDKQTVIHAVFPNDEYNINSPLAIHKKFRSIHFLQKDKILLQDSGYSSFPYAICEFTKYDNEDYPRGPGIDNLANIKLLNNYEKSLLITIQRLADPTWIVPEGASDLIDKSIGSVIFWKPTGISNNKPEQMQYNMNPAYFENLIAKKEKDLFNGFFLDIFDPLGDMRNITATEAEIRNTNKIIPFAPIAGNIHSNFLSIVIDRIFHILLSNEEFLQSVPESIIFNKSEYKVEFTSKMALAIKKLETIGWIQTMGSLQGIIQVSPEVLDLYDFDKIAKDITQANGVNPTWILSDKKVQEKRDVRAQQAQQAQMQNSIINAANALPINEEIEPNSIMGNIFNGNGING